MLTQLQQRELFHLTFLRAFVRRMKPGTYALKGGTNLRFFFGSVRYSEDMDLDIRDVELFRLKEIVMDIIVSGALATFLRTYGIEQIIPPNIKTAKQTETVQRFKVHLIPANGEDLFTKIEFSRRGLDNGVRVEFVNDAILKNYHMSPVIVAHYAIESAMMQKLSALTGRSAPQARDIFDLFILSSQTDEAQLKKLRTKLGRAKQDEARDVIFSVRFENFKDTVCQYLSSADYDHYAAKEIWEEIQLKTAELLGK